MGKRGNEKKKRKKDEENERDTKTEWGHQKHILM